MSNWKNGFENHQLKQRIENCLTIWNSLDTNGLNDVQLQNFTRVVKLLSALKVRFYELDPEFYPVNNFNQFPNWLQNIQNYGEGFRSNKNPTYIQNANDVIDQILSNFRSNDFLPPNKATEIISEITDSFQRKIVGLLKEAEIQVQNLKGESKSTGESIGAIKAKVDQTNQTIEQQKARLDQSISSFQKQFSEAEASRAKDFSAATQKNIEIFNSSIQNYTKQINSFVDGQQKQFDQFFESSKRKAEESFSFLKEKEEQVKKIFNVIGNLAVAGEYKTTADQEAKSANIFRWIALGLMLSMIVLAAATFYESLQHPEIDWRLFAFRLTTSIILLVPAVYAAQESSKHRQREKANRKLHLELSAIDAYLVLLPVEKRNEIKAQLTDKFFGQPDVQDVEDEVTKHALFDLVSDVVKSFTKAK